jgi:hypothetical protein
VIPTKGATPWLAVIDDRSCATRQWAPPRGGGEGGERMMVWSTDAWAEEAFRCGVARGESVRELGSRLTGESLDTPNFCILPRATAHDLRRPEVLVQWTQ